MLTRFVIKKKKKITEVRRFSGKNATEMLCQQSICQSQVNSKKWMKQKVTPLAAAVSKHSPLGDHTIRQGVRIQKEQFPSATISVPIARKRETGEMSAQVTLRRKPKQQAHGAGVNASHLALI